MGVGCVGVGVRVGGGGVRRRGRRVRGGEGRGREGGRGGGEGGPQSVVLHQNSVQRHSHLHPDTTAEALSQASATTTLAGFSTEMSTWSTHD